MLKSTLGVNGGNKLSKRRATTHSEYPHLVHWQAAVGTLHMVRCIMRSHLRLLLQSMRVCDAFCFGVAIKHLQSLQSFGPVRTQSASNRWKKKSNKEFHLLGGAVRDNVTCQPISHQGWQGLKALISIRCVLRQLGIALIWETKLIGTSQKAQIALLHDGVRKQLH